MSSYSLHGSPGPWEDVESYPIGKLASGKDEGVSAQFQIAWDHLYLHLVVQVVDGAPYSDSKSPADDASVEVFMDMDHDRTTSYGDDDAHFIASAKGIATSSKAGSVGVLSATQTVHGGYVKRLDIPWLAALGVTPAPGARYGLDVAVNYDENGGTRDGQLVWAGTANDDTDTSAFGDLVLEGCD